jgi:molybdopterin synthase catalytic subunit
MIGRRMQITVRYFASIREVIGLRSEVRDVPESMTAGALLDQIVREHPEIEGLRRASRIMLNQDYAEPDQLLSDGDELALIPPVSGGSDAFRVTDQPIDMQALAALVSSQASGAVTTFAGQVRDNARGRGVLVLEYEAYESAAEKALAKIGADIRERWDIEGIAITHRVGRLEIGEISVGIAVASAHRAEAFDACRHAIEQIKRVVPIWKKEFYAGGETWIGSEAEYQAAYGGSNPRSTS